jgi:hypothetical protein
VIGSSLFDFSAPVEDAVLAESCVNTVAVSDIKKQLGMDSFGTRGRTRIRDGRWIETVTGIDAAKVDLLRRGLGGWIISLWGAYATTYSKLAATDAARGIAKIDICNSVVDSSRQSPGHISWCGTCSRLKSTVSFFEGLGDVSVPLTGVRGQGREILFRDANCSKGLLDCL